MRLGIIGLPNSGKTTLFNALTGQDVATGAAAGRFEVHTAVVSVPDERVDRLSALCQPRKTTHIQVTCSDIAGLEQGVSQTGIEGRFRQELEQVDGFVLVLRAFDNVAVPHPCDSVDPARDLEMLDAELLLHDLVALETRLERIDNELRLKGRRAPREVRDEGELLGALQQGLEEGRPLRACALSPAQRSALRGFGFLTLKPMLIVLNVDDSRAEGKVDLPAAGPGVMVTALRGRLEAEIANLDDGDAALFMEEYGIPERSADKVIRLSFELLQLRSFFTINENELRAWSLPAGSGAAEAAGVVHTDMQRGFIRAEVMRSEDLLAADGRESDLRRAGLLRLEGRDYKVQDGDVLRIRFNV
ncbi:MAG: DUF933 domain-containing protein [Anaerolineaceae bacterium]|nr:DUF933 domain-containing protein [Anaerolineaceae bacterium]